MTEDWLHSHDCTAREIYQVMKSFPATRNTPVLAISTPADLEVTAKHARADGIIAKPFEH
jgi:hypothetical protein